MTEAEATVGFIPGDTIELSFEFKHQMYIDQVAAVFTNLDASEPFIVLSGTPDTFSEVRGSTNDFRSTVTLYAEIEEDHVPGGYRCTEVFVLTRGGQKISFSDTPGLGFWVAAEPDVPPEFVGDVRPGPTK